MILVELSEIMLELFETIRWFYLKASVSLKVLYLLVEIVDYNIVLYFVYIHVCSDDFALIDIVYNYIQISHDHLILIFT